MIFAVPSERISFDKCMGLLSTSNFLIQFHKSNYVTWSRNPIKTYVGNLTDFTAFWKSIPIEYLLKARNLKKWEISKSIQNQLTWGCIHAFQCAILFQAAYVRALCGQHGNLEFDLAYLHLWFAFAFTKTIGHLDERLGKVFHTKIHGNISWINFKYQKRNE